ncbi:hypothetical protein [uncultured Roseovarius sp.]|uniref:hypothetical protein n=1 Tax=uncultured Roseovarius sp. TaxID=293344 RepID=UPI0026344E42|nr:hypothetical protein [uncultured Roseovarius sp.]
MTMSLNIKAFDPLSHIHADADEPIVVLPMRCWQLYNFVNAQRIFQHAPDPLLLWKEGIINNSHLDIMSQLLT